MEDQWKKQTVGIAGCGGLGGYLVEYFLRLGLQHLVVCDGDVFDATNMDRQILCTQDVIGRKKVEVARERAMRIAKETIFEAHDVFVDEQNGEELFRDCVLVVDALDTFEGRRNLREICKRLGVPMVHGAICDWSLEVGVLYPGACLPAASEIAKREAQVLSYVPAVCAGMQAAEAVKILRGEKSSLTGKIRYIDLKAADSFELLLDQEDPKHS